MDMQHLKKLWDLEDWYNATKRELELLLESPLSSLRRWELISQVEAELFEVERELLMAKGFQYE